MFIPANIRFAFYAKREDVKLENKFSAVPIVLPLCDSMESSYKPIKKITNAIKNSFEATYATYKMT